MDKQIAQLKALCEYNCQLFQDFTKTMNIQSKDDFNQFVGQLQDLLHNDIKMVGTLLQQKSEIKWEKVIALKHCQLCESSFDSNFDLLCHITADHKLNQSDQSTDSSQNLTQQTSFIGKRNYTEQTNNFFNIYPRRMEDKAEKLPIALKCQTKKPRVQKIKEKCNRRNCEFALQIDFMQDQVQKLAEKGTTEIQDIFKQQIQHYKTQKGESRNLFIVCWKYRDSWMALDCTSGFCVFCKKTFSNQNNLKAHILQKHQE